ncbi:MAG: hypothetical protein ACI9G1_002372 [Pirellulaceae bacterium]|jgi:hypothetical protein
MGGSIIGRQYHREAVSSGQSISTSRDGGWESIASMKAVQRDPEFK